MVRSNKRIENYYNGLIAQYPYDKLIELDSFNGEGCEEDWKISNKEKVHAFLEIVLPSLCSKYYVYHTLMHPNREYAENPHFQKFHCLFPVCFYEINAVEFSTRQSLLRHIMNFHGEKLPARGAFLGKPKEFGFIPVSEKASHYFLFECNNCEMQFNLSTEFASHKEICIRNADLSTNVSTSAQATAKDSVVGYRYS
jgi:hypothetical protein